MQAKFDLSFYQDLLVHYYHFTLENGVYATCLALSVWLVTSALYSISMAGLSRRNRNNLKVIEDTQNELQAAKQQIQALQEELTVSQQAIEQETQRATALQERIAAIGGQLSESIVALANEADLGQQGLSVKEGLPAEQLWQRYSIAVKQIGENLVAEKRANSDLKQACTTQTAKVAEKDLELQVAQIRADGQKQQLAKLELLVEEHKTQLAQQQESAKLRLAEVEAKYQADLARLGNERPSSRQPLSTFQASPKIEVETIKPAEPVKPLESQPLVAPAAIAKSESQAVKVDSISEQFDEVRGEPLVGVVAHAKQQAAKSAETSPGGLGGKFKSLFGSSKKPAVEKPAPVETEAAPIVKKVEPVKAVQKVVEPKASGKSKSMFAGLKEKIDKLDKMMGQVTPEAALEEEPDLPRRMYAEPEAEVAAPPSAVPVSEAQVENTGKESSAGVGGKFKSMFGSSKKTASEPEVAEATHVDPEPLAVEQPTEKKGKLNKLFGKFKK